MAKKAVKPAGAEDTGRAPEKSASATPAQTPNNESPAAHKSEWENHLEVHPACALFPRLSDDELKTLADDIKANGLRDKVKVIKQYRKRPDGSLSVDDYDWVVIDGRNRLDAMELVGLPILKADSKPNFSNFYNVELESDAEI